METVTPKRVVLFGRTGAGKSTVANVLVTGGIERPVFPTSDGARGCTSSIKTEAGRGWVVIDTVGLGEAEVGTIPHTHAEKMLTDFLKEVRGEYSHIIYLRSRTRRIDALDDLIWGLFSKIFEGAEEAFVVLFTGADEQWLNNNRADFPEYLRDQHVVVTDIPPINKGSVKERQLKTTREKSIRKLEEDLDKHFNQRLQKNSVPQIARMNEEQLKTKSTSLLEFIIQQIQASWRTVVGKIAPLVNITGIVMNIISLASGSCG